MIPQHISNIIGELQKATNYELNEEIEKTVSNWYSKFIKNKFICPVCNGNGYKVETITKEDPFSGNYGMNHSGKNLLNGSKMNLMFCYTQLKHIKVWNKFSEERIKYDNNRKIS